MAPSAPSGAEEDVTDLLQQIFDRLAVLAQPGEGRAEQDGDDQDRDQVALGEGADEILRHQIEQKARHVERLALVRELLDRVDLGAGGGRAVAGPQQIDDDHAEGECHGRHDLEIQERLAADPADLAHVTHMGDAGHHRQEDHRRDHQLDQLDERGPQRLKLLRQIRIVDTQQDADDDRHQDLEGEVLVKRTVLGR
jgi:hypothetical protein